MQQAIDVSCPLGPQQQTCSSGFAGVDPYWDRRTDGQTDGHYIVTQTLLRIDAGNATKRLLQTRRAAIDRYRLTAGPTAANPPHAAAAVNRWDRPVA